MELLYISLCAALAVTLLTVGVISMHVRKQIDKLYGEAKRGNRLEDILMTRGWRSCGVCGKIYEPLNEERYSPELDICRDCLWKMYYFVIDPENRQASDSDISRNQQLQ